MISIGERIYSISGLTCIGDKFIYIINIYRFVCPIRATPTHSNLLVAF